MIIKKELAVWVYASTSQTWFLARMPQSNWLFTLKIADWRKNIYSETAIQIQFCKVSLFG